MGISLPIIIMKVADIMSRQVDFVRPTTSVKEVSRIIFSLGINGVPVCEGRKVVGFITERDILAKFFPSIEEYIQDALSATDFEGMEEKVSEILSMPVTKIMARNLTTVSASTPVLRAQSLMSSHKLSRLPVVDSEGNLIGILSRGDIFRALVEQKLILHEEEGFYDWLARYYDTIVDWEKRLESEIPELSRLFKKEEVRKVLDIASGTGEHTLALAKEGFEVFGLEKSSVMTAQAIGKKTKLAEKVQDNAQFINGTYKNIVGKSPRDFDSAIFMGNVLPYIQYSDEDILKEVLSVLNPKKAVVVIQLANFEKALSNGGVREFIQRKSSSPYSQEYVFFGLYMEEKGKENILSSTRMIFDVVKDTWRFRSINSTPVLKIGKTDIEKMFKKEGFTDITFFGSKFYEPILQKPFDIVTHDWLNVVAKRG